MITGPESKPCAEKSLWHVYFYLSRNTIDNRGED